ncbi:hydantoinase/oxoprolinase family protein [Terrarubrum flagellatum]|uniref:hydantoinase/oxoprolinase family protein n=1 Tax=Terrirubrum flagellatum TaxID=2895980 RepID=UPI0031452681
MNSYRIGVDIGGTFTDFALFDDESQTARSHKRLTTPADPSEAVIEGCQHILRDAGLAMSDVLLVSHGTTLVTNAIIERKGAPIAMLVTRGFRDLLDMGQERRYDLFDLRLRFPEPVVSRALRFEINERIRHDGSELAPLSFDGVEAFLADAIATRGVEAVAICLLHSYADTANENALAAFIRDRFPDLKISTSASVFPFAREYPRWTTACLNAYVQPLVYRYLETLDKSLRALGFTGRLLIMGASGGSLTPELARQFPIRLLESGPAAGALMSARHARILGADHALSFDMGGTTAKGCLVRSGAPLKRYDFEVARVHEFKLGSGLPVKIPVLDMIEIGAGGGSIASIDARGLIAVGPRSAGADPGPACYGRGGRRPTLTDANLALGYLDAASFLGGEMQLEKSAAETALQEKIAGPLGIDIARAAWGIHEIISEDVARAFRVHASERGVDCRRCAMIVFGGSGPLHGARVARKLHMSRVICPVGSGIMSAFGLLSSPIAFEVARSRRLQLERDAQGELEQIISQLAADAKRMLEDAGASVDETRIETRLDLRYEGQGYEIEIAADRLDAAKLRAVFESEHRRVFGFDFAGRAIEIVNWKVEISGPASEAEIPHRLLIDRDAREALKGLRPAWSSDLQDFAPWPVYDRYAMPPGFTIEGPALIEERESTCVIHAGDRLIVDADLNLVIDVRL